MKKLRSQAWFGGQDKDGFIHRSWMKNNGLPDDAFDGRPIIGICNTFSDFTPCNAHFRELITHIKAGVLEAGGLPLEFPVFSCGESNLRPTAMLFRNLASMDVEEAIRANPMDGVVLMVGCDKTTPSLVMGAATCDLPTIAVSGGPMLNGRYKGKAIGSGTDVWKFSEEVRSGEMTPQAFANAESAMSRSPGHCMTMGTASTMASMVEALGITLAGNAAWPAVDARRARLARMSGRRIVEMVRQDQTLSQILTKQAFENAIKVIGAIGGSTNAVVHLLAIAGRIGVDLTLDDWDRAGRDVPTIVDLMPSGRFLMEELAYAGGIPAVMKRIEHLLHLDVMTATGTTMRDRLAEADVFDDEVIRPLSNPLVADGGLAVLRGNLAPKGAILKPSAATPALMQHRGRAVVFDDIDDFKARRRA
jgi:dihydroxy-acid dehydratase